MINSSSTSSLNKSEVCLKKCLTCDVEIPLGKSGDLPANVSQERAQFSSVVASYTPWMSKHYLGHNASIVCLMYMGLYAYDKSCTTWMSSTMKSFDLPHNTFEITQLWQINRKIHC